MWQGENTWLHYVKNIIAADVPSAVFLSSFLRALNISKNYAATLEVIDLQKYKIISSRNKVLISLNKATYTPFIFIVGKN